MPWLLATNIKLEFANILPWLTIKQDALALLPRDECLHHLGFESANVHADCGGVVVNYFKQVLHLPVVVVVQLLL